MKRPFFFLLFFHRLSFLQVVWMIEALSRETFETLQERTGSRTP